MPLHLAAMNGHGQIAKLLCCFGANVNATVSYFQTLITFSLINMGPSRIFNTLNI